MTRYYALLGVKNVTYNEPFFQGHFPHMAIFPGVLILEALAQATGLLASETSPDELGHGMTYFLTSSIVTSAPITEKGPIWTSSAISALISTTAFASINLVTDGCTSNNCTGNKFTKDPQDKKYADEKTSLTIGDRNVIREFATLHRGTLQDHAETRIGNDNLFMAYTHVAHDCVIGNNVIMANGASLAGHVHLCDNAILGGFTLVHQFTQIGTFSFSAMGSAITPIVKLVFSSAYFLSCGSSAIDVN
jgi:hypothetical protein